MDIRKTRPPSLLIASLILLLCFRLASAGSPLSARGIGVPGWFPSGKAIGMGGVGISILDSLDLNRLNPAALIPLTDTRVSTFLLYESTKTVTDVTSLTSSCSNFDGFVFALPLKRSWAIGVGLTPLTDVDFYFSSKQILAEQKYEKSIRGGGGLNAGSLFTAIALGRVHLGVDAQFIFGKTEETWRVNYSNDLFDDSIHYKSTSIWGWNFKLGMILRLSRINLGAIFSPGCGLRYKTEQAYQVYHKLPKKEYRSVHKSEINRGSMDFPLSWGLGISWDLKGKYLLGLDFYDQDWRRFKIDGITPSEMNDSYRVSIGAEITPSRGEVTPYFKRISYRCGYSYSLLYYKDLDGKGLHQYLFTFGLGLPFNRNRGKVDLALEFGKRESLGDGLKENILRIAISLAGGERWFLKEK